MPENNQPLVSVIMNCLNCEKYLKEAIDSVYSQTYQNWEIIFWDNASTDDSAKIARSYDSRLRYFHGEETIPLGAARNKAIEQTRGEFIAFLDCDDLWMPEKLEKQCNLFEKDIDTGLVFSNAVRFKDNGHSKEVFSTIKPPRGRVFEKLALRNFIVMSTVIIRRSVLEKIGGWFDEKLDLVEDLDISLRVAWKYKLDYDDKPLAKWRIHSDNYTFCKFDLFPKEVELILAKLIRLYPDLEESCPAAVEALQRNIDFKKSVSYWANGQSAEARKHIRPYLGGKKYFLFYLVTFFPKSLYNLFARMYFFTRISEYR